MKITDARTIWHKLRSAILGRTVTNERTASEVDSLLDGTLHEGVTKELFDFGRYLLDQNNARDAAIDEKATSIVGYSAAILAFLVTRESSWTHSPAKLVALVVIAALAISASAYAGLALRAARNWNELSEATWFPGDTHFLSDEDQLRRYYLTAMHQVHQENHKLVNQKADQMIWAQISVAAASILLGSILFGSAVSSLVGHL